jgi:hypothetical protein
MITVLLVLIALALAAIAFVLWRRNAEMSRLYAPVRDIQGEVRRGREEVLAQRKQKDQLAKEYADLQALLARLRAEVAAVEENVEAISVGLYKPHYNYDSSDQYRKALDIIWDKQKALLKAGQAATCDQEWEVTGDKKAGAKMTKQYLKLILRAFNGECDAAMAKVTWSNATKMEERIRKTYDSINELGEVMQMRIRPDYLRLKLGELHLEVETAQKKRDEQEEQRRIKEQMREEERALREAEKAKQEAEAEEERYESALAKARAEMQSAQGEALALLQQKIQNLDAALHVAHEKKERAKSMAQLTRSGHVYVISNVGSFGENVFKIGMTRRLEPMDRIWELGDASVPFDFDVHALVYCDDAPSLECAFQNHFRDRQINMVNPRKEFFNVTLDEVDAVARAKGVKLELTRLAEAKEYRETLALRAEANGAAAAFAVGRATA